MTMEFQLDEREAQAMEAALAGLRDSAGQPDPAVLPAEADPALVRDYTEVFGLLPYDLEPDIPRPELRQQILGRVGSAAVPRRGVDDLTLVQATPRKIHPEAPASVSVASAPAGVAEAETSVAPAQVAPPAGVPAAGPEVVDRTLVRMPTRPMPAVEPPASSAPAQVVGFPQAPPTRPSSGWGTFAMAAVLGLCLLGMGFFAGKMFEQQSTIDRLNQDLRASMQSENQLRAELGELARMRNDFQMITTNSRHVYPMRPSGRTAQVAGDVRGMVFVCGRHQQWYLNLHGLDPAPEGQEYQLWFMTEKGMMPGGTVEVGPEAGELRAPSMPDNTQGFAVTLEHKGFHTEPEGEIVLIADKSVSL